MCSARSSSFHLYRGWRNRQLERSGQSLFHTYQCPRYHLCIVEIRFRIRQSGPWLEKGRLWTRFTLKWHKNPFRPKFRVSHLCTHLMLKRSQQRQPLVSGVRMEWGFHQKSCKDMRIKPQEDYLPCTSTHYLPIRCYSHNYCNQANKRRLIELSTAKLTFGS
jgi:hypothetical protein